MTMFKAILIFFHPSLRIIVRWSAPQSWYAELSHQVFLRVLLSPKTSVAWNRLPTSTISPSQYLGRSSLQLTSCDEMYSFFLFTFPLLSVIPHSCDSSWIDKYVYFGCRRYAGCEDLDIWNNDTWSLSNLHAAFQRRKFCLHPICWYLLQLDMLSAKRCQNRVTNTAASCHSSAWRVYLPQPTTGTSSLR